MVVPGQRARATRCLRPSILLYVYMYTSYLGSFVIRSVLTNVSSRVCATESSRVANKEIVNWRVCAN